MRRTVKKRKVKLSTLRVLKKIETQGSLNQRTHYQVSRFKKRGYLDKYSDLTEKARKLLKNHLI